MYCTNCGCKIKKGERFCTKCGEKLDMELYEKRIKPIGENRRETQKSYSLGDLGKDGVPGSKVAAFGVVITLLSLVMGSLGIFTTIIAFVLLIIARNRGFKSIWIWVGTGACVFLFFRAVSISEAETSLSNALFFNNMFSFLGLFF